MSPAGLSNSTPRGDMAQHIIDVEDAHDMSRALAYDLAKQSYKL